MIGVAWEMPCTVTCLWPGTMRSEPMTTHMYTHTQCATAKACGLSTVHRHLQATVTSMHDYLPFSMYIVGAIVL